MKPLIVSFYTPAYQDEAMALANSLDALGIDDYAIVAVDDRGSWERNCAYKPTFILKMMEGHDRPIVWLDADARVRRKPDLFDSITADVACHYRNGVELLSGTLWFNNSATASELLELWHQECEVDPSVWDQRALQAMLEREKRFNVFRLPSAYTRVFDDPKMGEPVIEHTQASRRLANR